MKFDPFTLHELGVQDFERGEARCLTWTERTAGWDAACADSLAKAAGGLRRVHAGRYESEDGRWHIVHTDRDRWTLLSGLQGLRSQSEIGSYHTFAEAMEALRAEAQVV